MAPRERKDERIEFPAGHSTSWPRTKWDENAGALDWPDCSALLFVRSTEHGSAGPQPAADAQRWSPPTYFTCRCFNGPHEGWADWIVTIYEGHMFDEPVVEAPCSVRMKGVAEQEYGQRAYSEEREWDGLY